MMILLKIAFRNLREHKIKTLIIGSLIAVGIAFLVIGNSVMDTITSGMQASFRRNFTSDLILRSPSEEDVSFFGGFGAASPILKDYPQLVEEIKAIPGIESYTPMLNGAASISQNDESLSFALLWGIEPESYREMFAGSFTLAEGEDLQSGQEGIVLSQSIVDEIEEDKGIRLEPGDKILLSGQNNNTGTKIREVTLRGIGYFENSVGLLERISFIDVNTLRALNGLTSFQAVKDEASLETVDETNLFGGEGNLFEDDLFGEAVVSDDASVGEPTLDFDNILGDTSVREQYLSLDNNAWQFLLLKLAPGASETQVKAALAKAPLSSQLLSENWRWAAGFIAGLAYGIRGILNVVIFAVAIVAIIIIMNTLVISITERFAEIGTIRAIGGQRQFIRSMITTEVLMTTIVFGLLGMLIGAAIVGLFYVIGVEANNIFFQILFGGQVLKPVLSPGSLIISFVTVAVIGVISSLYPTSVALGISPVQAMQRR
ncbi:MAG: FtsX-like permease family protein [Deinococcales bacterium]